MKPDGFLNQVLQPGFLDGGKGRLFYLYHAPQPGRAVFLFLPSFAEELNRCRVMVALQARKLSALGYGCLLLDYYGTGDSQGDFSETSWAQWRDDAMSAQRWLAAQGHEQIVLWGNRVGALLASELAAANDGAFSRLLLWQPVLDGQTFLTQFLRVRMTMLMDRGEPKETTQQMRQQLQQGTVLEVAGYALTPEMAAELDAKKLVDFSAIKVRVDWCEMILNEEAELSLASQKVLGIWREHGVEVFTHTFTGPAFWQLHERELTPALLDKTTALFS